MIMLLVLAGMFEALQRADSRVAEIAWRLQTANVALCRKTAPLAGFSVQTLDQFDPALRATARTELGLGDLPQVSAVVPGSAAARAGVARGDVIKAIDGAVISPGLGGPANYSSTGAVETMLATALAHPPARLTVGSRTLELSPDQGCASQVQLIPEAKFDASADGRYVQISGPIYEFTSGDSELAFLVAHELAHNLFPQAARVGGAGAGQRAAELAADSYAVWMMARAGYDVAAAGTLLQRLRAKRPLSWLDGTHPRWQARIAAVELAMADVRRRQTRGVPLIPPFWIQNAAGTTSVTDR